MKHVIEVAMSAFTAIAAVAVLTAWSAASFAQEPAAPPPPPPAAAVPPAAEVPPPPAQPPSTASDDEFIPTQEISADEAVTFPVDI